ncbi:MAG: methyltransferase domain-containing protein [Alphaproteobacteria bacterium]|nr:methyltransferase domain-containing protein [Alphaproteobacteria bacterium]
MLHPSFHTVCKGIEPEAAAAEEARQRGLDVETGFFPNDLRDPGAYDIIVFNDVFEHLPLPSSIIKEAARLLNSRGILVINLPSSAGILFKTASILDALGWSSWHERLWQKNFLSPHLSYFNPENLKRLVEQYPNLTRVNTFSLPSVARDGLAARISTSHRSGAGLIALAGLWAFSFFLPMLPSDIHVSVFQKSSS